ncbi:MAG: hypothetical protein IIA55_12940 [Gemmatimonadetes bacterium]|nr:hypothetical protein [Gemmatimonadota bacterium]
MASATAVADNEGRFSLEVEAIGVYVLRVEQLGYEDSQAVLPSTAPIEFTTISIQPKPIELQGLEVSVASQFEQRRTASAREVRVLDQVAIAELGGYGRETLKRAIPLTRLCFLESGDLCFLGIGGSKQMVSICFDELRAYGGVGDLDRMSPWDIHSIELFDRGRHVRIYTREFVARLLAEGRRLRPLNWC